LCPEDGVTRIQATFDQDTVWLSIDQMAELFQRDKSVIGKHVRSIFSEGELDKKSVWAKFAYTASDGKTYQVDYYNLDVIISVGYRVKSIRGTQFKIWALKVLKDYLLKGYSVNQRIERIDKHNSQYSPIKLEVFTNSHDRFLCIDDTVYHIGASLKDLGKKWFAFSKMEIDTESLIGKM
jgi:hypothetical protein